MAHFQNQNPRRTSETGQAKLAKNRKKTRRNPDFQPKSFVKKTPLFVQKDPSFGGGRGGKSGKFYRSTGQRRESPRKPRKRRGAKKGEKILGWGDELNQPWRSLMRGSQEEEVIVNGGEIMCERREPRPKNERNHVRAAGAATNCGSAETANPRPERAEGATTPGTKASNQNAR